MRILPVFIALFFGLAPGAAQALELKPYKDQLFAYPKTLAEADGGGFVTVDYQEMRDINARDEIPERRVKPDYVQLSVRSVQKDLVVATSAGAIAHVAAGKTEGASVITVYLHGQGGSRRQGVDDFTFGGNFNRIKNLMW
ncbi:MAG: alpha/beta hydrolase, partial [Mesorhizobium sp.]|nr:alpha/beta hydrolase [Mesorhizobium sp.]